MSTSTTSKKQSARVPIHRKPKGEFNQVVFFELLREKLDKTNYQIAIELGISDVRYRQYTSGRNRLRVETLLDWMNKLHISEHKMLFILMASQRQ